MDGRPIQKLFLPVSFLAGAIGLMLGPGALGALSRFCAGTHCTNSSGHEAIRVTFFWSVLTFIGYPPDIQALLSVYS